MKQKSKPYQCLEDSRRLSKVKALGRLLAVLFAVAGAASVQALTMVLFGTPRPVYGGPPAAWPPITLTGSFNPIEVAASPNRGTLFLNADGGVIGCQDETLGNSPSNSIWPLGGVYGASNNTWRRLLHNGNPNKPLTNFIGIASAGKVDSGMGIALRGDGVPYTWGWIPTSEIGNGASRATIASTWSAANGWLLVPSTQSSPVPTPVLPVTTNNQIGTGMPGFHLQNIKQVSQSATAFFALASNGIAHTWGHDVGSLGVFGLNSVGAAELLTPTQVPTLTNLKQIDLGLNHGAGLRANGTVVCWGSNTQGQCGQNSTATRFPLPVQIVTQPGMPLFKKVACSQEATYALGANGEVWGWGQNPASNNVPTLMTQPAISGNFIAPQRIMFSQTQPLNDIIDIWAGLWQVYALRGDGTVIGLGLPAHVSYTYSLGREPVNIGGPIVDDTQTVMSHVISGAASHHGMFLLASMTPHKWPAGSLVAYPPNPLLPATTIPSVPAQIPGIRKLALSSKDFVMIDNRGRVVLNHNGTYHDLTPTGQTFIDVAIFSKGQPSVVAINTRGELWASGSLVGYGFPSTPATDPLIPVPLLPSSPDQLLQVEIIRECITVLRANGQMLTRSASASAVLGNGASPSTNAWNTVRFNALQVANNAIQISSANVPPIPNAGIGHSIALFANSSVASWGGNATKQLGRATTTHPAHFASPVCENQKPNGQFIDPMRRVKQVVAGQGFNYALYSNGWVGSWGDNTFGQLGWGGLISNTNVRVVSPVTTNLLTGSPLSNIKEIAVSLRNGFFLGANGQVFGIGKKDQVDPSHIQPNVAMARAVVPAVSGVWRLFKSGDDVQGGAAIR